MENRSLVHMIGWMKKSINPSINGVTGNECIFPSSNPALKICFSDDTYYFDPDPGQSFEAVYHQIFGSPASSFPTMFCFVDQALSISPNLSSTVMKGFSPQPEREAGRGFLDLDPDFVMYGRFRDGFL